MSRVLGRRPIPLTAAHRGLVSVGAVLVIGATAALVLSLNRSEPAKVVAASDTVVALDPQNDRLVDRFGAGRVPTQPAAGTGAVWVFNSADGSLSQIDPHTRAIRSFSIGPSRPQIGLALGRGTGWVAAGTVYRFDLHTAAAHTLRLPRRGWAGLVAADASDVWIIGGRRLVKPPPSGGFAPLSPLAWHIDPQTDEVSSARRIEAAVFGESSPMAAVIAGNSLWVRGQLGVARFDRRSGRLISQLRMSDPAHANAPQWGGFVGGSGSLWVADIGHSVVWRVDLGTGKPLASIPVRGQPAGVATGAGAIWIADAHGTILKVDPRTNEIEKQIPVDCIPNGLTFSFGRLWIACD
jgi:streptogramin lyase